MRLIRLILILITISCKSQNQTDTILLPNDTFVFVTFDHNTRLIQNIDSSAVNAMVNGEYIVYSKTNIKDIYYVKVYNRSDMFLKSEGFVKSVPLFYKFLFLKIKSSTCEFVKIGKWKYYNK